MIRCSLVEAIENLGRRLIFSSGLLMELEQWPACSLLFHFVGYLLGALRKQQVQWVRLGAPGKFPVNETRLETSRIPCTNRGTAWPLTRGVYVRNLGKDNMNEDCFLVFAMNCAHLGCRGDMVSAQSGLFMCPCHGGVYYENGERASGPPHARGGLFQCVWRIQCGPA